MTSVTVSGTVDAPIEDVWKLFADHGNVHKFHPGIEQSSYLNKKAGKGGQRACEFGKGKGVNETITAWKKHELMSFTATEFRKLPMKKMNGHFRFFGSSPTTIEFEMEYAMNGGAIMNFMARGMMKKAGSGMLEGARKSLSPNSAPE